LNIEGVGATHGMPQDDDPNSDVSAANRDAQSRAAKPSASPNLTPLTPYSGGAGRDAAAETEMKTARQQRLQSRRSEYLLAQYLFESPDREWSADSSTLDTLRKAWAELREATSVDEVTAKYQITNAIEREWLQVAFENLHPDKPGA
jgi:hypothetical protein